MNPLHNDTMESILNFFNPLYIPSTKEESGETTISGKAKIIYS